ncbi:MAG: hypothetical protein C4523_14685 [Myxococcales bacterium]|nr:MAG: hypothetical protein C4523_14685 [Myxococcales bacterium]
MRHLLLAALVACGVAFAVAPASAAPGRVLAPEWQSPPDPHFADRLREARDVYLQAEVRPALAKQRLMERLGRLGGRASGDAYEISRVTGVFSLDPGTQTLQAEVEIAFTVSEEMPQESFWIDPFETIETALDGEPIAYAPEWYYGQHLATIAFDPTLEAGSTHTLRFIYSGAVDCEGSIIYDIPACLFDAEATVFISNMWLPMGATIYSDTYFPTDFTITFPEGQVAAASGVLTEETENPDAGTVTRRYILDQPHEGGTIVADTYATYTAASQNGVEIGIRLTGFADVGDQWADYYARILDDYAIDYAPYPSPIFNASEVPDSIGAGLGYYAGVLIPRGSFQYGLESDGHYNSIHAHEAAHNWFPGLVPVSDTYAPWLSEGFAEYSAVQHGLLYFPTYTAAYMRVYSQILTMTARLDDTYDRALSGDMHIYDDEWAYTLVTYNKGALALLQLHNLYTEDAFRYAMIEYVADNYYEDVNTRTLEHSLAASLNVLREDMTIEDYFDEWVYGRGYPEYTVEVKKEWDEDLWKTTVVVTQTGEKVFSIPQEVALYTADEATTPTQTISGADDQTLVFETVAEPGRVVFDPSWKTMKIVRPALEGDANTSGEVDGVDLLLYAYSAGASVFNWNMAYSTAVDFNLDGEINDDDLDVITAHFGEAQE